MPSPETEPASALTLARPEIWTAVLGLATTTTGYLYVPKVPLTMCGGSPPTAAKLEAWRRIREDMHLRRQSSGPGSRFTHCGEVADSVNSTLNIDEATCRLCLREASGRAAEMPLETDVSTPSTSPIHLENEVKPDLAVCGVALGPYNQRSPYEKEVTCEACLDARTNVLAKRAGELINAAEEARRRADELRKTKLVIPVPEGSVEWVLHEMGHWVAATPAERLLPDYGYGQEVKGVGKAREWQAWAFEEIVLAPWGPSRNFCPPPHRGGVAFKGGNEPIPPEHLRHVERALQSSGVSVEQWRRAIMPWLDWEAGRSTPSWCRDD